MVNFCLLIDIYFTPKRAPSIPPSNTTYAIHYFFMIFIFKGKANLQRFHSYLMYLITSHEAKVNTDVKMMRCPYQTLLACLSIDLYFVYLFLTTYKFFLKDLKNHRAYVD